MLTTVEKAVTKRIVETALALSYKVGVSADGETICKPSKSIEKILKNAFNCDFVELELDGNNNNGFISLNFFNDGLEIISDYSVNLENFIDSISFKSLIIDL